MKLRLIRAARIQHMAGEIVEVSPAEAGFLLSTRSAEIVPEGMPGEMLTADEPEAMEKETPEDLKTAEAPEKGQAKETPETKTAKKTTRAKK